MEANAVVPSSHHRFPFTKRPSLIRNPMHLLRLTTLRAAGPSSTNSSSSSENESTTTNNNESKTDAASAARLPISTLNIRYKPRSKRQAAKLQQQQSIKAPPPPKDWESMTLGEKAVELYVGEKGLLFWLNKFAYASIFIIIGGWILFRFVGPNLGLYQLDAPPLSPTSILKGSS